VNVTNAVPAMVKSVKVRFIFWLWSLLNVTVVPPCQFKIAALEGESVAVVVMRTGVFPTFVRV
jgi:hypothetical protein